jgi:hypothetical protein
MSKRIGLFDALVGNDVSLFERSVINQNADELDAVVKQGDMLGGSIGALQARVVAQGRELERLRTVVGVLAGMLRDSGAIDAHVFDLRLEAMLEEQAEATRATATCLRCSRTVPAMQTELTALGPVCDRCAGQ